jgi:hypothetical protein
MFKGFLFCLLLALGLGVVSLVPSVVCAAELPAGGEAVTFTQMVDFNGTDGVLTKIKQPLAAILAGAIGIGLSIWAARFFFRIVKSMGR